MFRMPRSRSCLLASVACALACARSSANDKHDLHFAHCGKAGGGTVRAVTAEAGVTACRFLGSRQIHHVIAKCRMKVWHPGPNQQEIAPRVLINVRDPIDRFLSAVAWRKLLHCKPQNETRKQTSNTKHEKSAGQLPDTLCDRPSQRSRVFEKIRWDASTLAEGLCKKGDAGQLARRVMRMDPHLASRLVDHLGCRGGTTFEQIVASNRTTYYAVVLERGFDFAEQILGSTAQAMEDALGHDQAADRYPLLMGARPPPSNTPRAATRATGVRARSVGEHPSNTTIMVAGAAALDPPRLDLVGGGGGAGPASVSLQARGVVPGAGNSPCTDAGAQCVTHSGGIHPPRQSGITHSGGVHRPLSEGAVACLRRYYADDYTAIKILQRVGCHGKASGQCRSAAQFILDRRTGVSIQGRA